MLMRILVVGNDRDLRLWRAKFLSLSGFDVVLPSNKNAAVAAIRAVNLDALLVCYSLFSHTLLQITEEFRQRHPGGCIVAIKTGAYTDPQVQADVTLPVTASPEKIVHSIRTRCKVSPSGIKLGH